MDARRRRQRLRAGDHEGGRLARRRRPHALGLRWAAAAVAALLAVGGTLVLLATALVRRGVLAQEDARMLRGGVRGGERGAAPLPAAARRELFFGGTTGLVIDTFGIWRLAAPTARLSPDQIAWCRAGGLVAARLPLVLLTSARARREPAFSAPAALLGIIASLRAGRDAASCGRNAVSDGAHGLFLLLLMLIVIVLVADALATLGRLRRLTATAMVVLAAAASGAHPCGRERRAHARLARGGFDRGDAGEGGRYRWRRRDVRRCDALGVEWMSIRWRAICGRQASRGTRYVVTVLPEDARRWTRVRAARVGAGQGRELQRFARTAVCGGCATAGSEGW